MTFQPSQYQQAIFDWISKSDHKNLVVEALAGTGKTTTLVEALKIIPEGKSVLYLAFNRHIANELITKVPENTTVKTYHEHGNHAVQAVLTKSRLGKQKMQMLFKYHYPEKGYAYQDSVLTLISLLKASLVPLTSENMAEMVLRHDLDTMGDEMEYFEVTRNIMKFSTEDLSEYTFDDMCWLPVTQNYPIPQYDYVFIDEAQDTNRVQMELALRSVKPDGRIVAVGDRFQSIYGFRGADTDAIPNLISGLKADVLPLSISYRCPKSHIRQCNTLFPKIPIQAAPWAIEGSIDMAEEEDFYGTVKPGDIVICRTNAPLVEPAFTLLRRGVKVSIKGKDIGKNLNSLIDRSGAKELGDLHNMLYAYVEKEVKRLIGLKKVMSAVTLEDKRDTILAIARESKNIWDLRTKIKSIFEDDSVPEIMFSTIHKAKGLEARNIFVINKQLMPHPKAELNWEIDQEYNMMYVAFTRSLDNLIYVNIPIRKY
jgi:DNA helicase-2/ATP-dependent DNA helicase PcrA